MGAETLAGDGDSVGVVERAIQSHRSQQWVAEQLRPFVQGTVARDDRRAAFVAFSDGVEPVFGSQRAQRFEAEVVHDE